jgi:hypothetical protein
MSQHTGSTRRLVSLTGTVGCPHLRLVCSTASSIQGPLKSEGPIVLLWCGGCVWHSVLTRHSGTGCVPTKAALRHRGIRVAEEIVFEGGPQLVSTQKLGRRRRPGRTHPHRFASIHTRPGSNRHANRDRGLHGRIKAETRWHARALPVAKAHAHMRSRTNTPACRLARAPACGLRFFCAVRVQLGAALHTARGQWPAMSAIVSIS